MTDDSATGRFRLSLLPELLRVLLARVVAPLRRVWRASWAYRAFLAGKMPDRIVFHPHDARPRHLEDADALLRGRFRFAGETVDVVDKPVFEMTPPSQVWAGALNGFAWLAPLSAAGGEPARRLATNLMAQWVKRNGRYSEPAWSPEILARRLTHIFAHGRFALANSDVLWRSKLFVSLREQSRMLARIAESAPEGFARLEAAAALALSGACLDDSPKRLADGLKLLEEEIGKQILPDGGHASRSPEALLEAHNLLLMVGDALTAIGQPTPPSIRNAHDRMAPMLRFFRMGDGTLAMFNGGNEGDAKMVESLLARDAVRGQPFAFAPHSGFHRMAAGRAFLVLDCGKTPEGVFANTAHAGCLSFEFSAGGQRLIVNCGSAPGWQKQWGASLRATAAHSTVTLADTSMAAVLSGMASNYIGPRLLDGPTAIETSRRDTPQGPLVEATHNGYEPVFGVLHQRRLALSSDGLRLAGEDRLVRRSGLRRGTGGIPFASRFHVHPDVRLSPNQAGGVLLKLPSGEGWRFQSPGHDVVIDESVYVGSGQVRKAEQFVIGGTVGHEAVEINWSLEKIPAA